MDAAVKSQGRFEARRPRLLGVGEAVGVGHPGEQVVLDDGAVAFLVAHQRPGRTLTLDDVVANCDRLEITILVETKQAVRARSGGGAGDDVVVADLQVVVGFVDPDHAATGIAHKIVVEPGRPFRGDVAEAGDKVAMVLFRIKVEQVVIDLRAVADELNRVTVAEVVVVNMEGAATGRHRPAGMLGYRDRAVKDVVVDLDVFIVLERHLDREIRLDGVVVDAAALALTDFDAIELAGFVFQRADKAVVGDFAVGHPDGEDRSASDASLDALLAAFPAPAGVDEFTVMDLRALHEKRAHAGPETIPHAQVMQM